MKKAVVWIILFLNFILIACDKQESNEECQHVYQLEKVTPTCMKEGYTLHTCQICKESYKTDLIPVVEHSYTSYVEDVPPTCDSFGIKKRYCIWCDYVQEEKILPLGHQYIKIEEQPATCTEDGYILYQCKESHTHTYKELILAKGHQYTQKEILIQPTCEEKGLGIRRCQNCDFYLEEELPAVGHNYKLISSYEPNCTESVTLQYVCVNDERHHYERVITPLGHDFIKTEFENPTCTDWGSSTEICENCGYEKVTYLEPYSHFWDSTILKEATCEESGSEFRKCIRCFEEEEVELEPLGHDYYIVSTIKNSTCFEEGQREMECWRCHKKTIQFTEKLEHSFSSWKNVRDSSLCESMHKMRECYLCHYQEHSTIVYKHTYGDWVVEDKPSTWEGTITQTRECVVCGHREELAIMNHNYGTYEVIIPATCKSIGKKVRECLICGMQDEQTIPLLDHNWVDEEIINYASCLSEGRKTVKCLSCEEIEEQVIPNLGHNWLDWEISIESTCELSGKKIRECEYCHSKEEMEVPIKQHQYSDWTYPNEISCEQTGLKQKECLLCHSIIQEEFIQEHHIENYICTLCGKEFPVYEIINDETAPFLYQDNMWISTNQTPDTISYFQIVAYERIEIHFDIGMQENEEISSTENYADSYFYFTKKGEQPSSFNAKILFYGTTLGVDSLIIEKGETYVLGYKTSKYCPKDAIFITICIKNFTIVRKED